MLDIVSNTANILTLDADVTSLGLTGNEAIVVATFYLPDGSFVSYFFGAAVTPNG